MLQVRRSEERGYADHGWLKSYHSFSFADYVDPRHMGWGNLRVINEDRIASGTGFGTHGHRDMEIVSVVLDGALSHEDSIGNVAVIRPHEVQRMTAGTGVRHSEFNHADALTHFLQIWLLPLRKDLPPGYDQRSFTPQDKLGQLRLVATPDAQDAAAAEALQLNADARVWQGHFDAGHTAEVAIDPARKAYVFVARGQITANGTVLNAGDALALADEPRVHLSDGADADVLVFDLAA